MKKYKIIVTTTNSIENLKAIRTRILNKKLSPCVQTINNLESHYMWKGKLVSDKEIMILIKTDKKNEHNITKEIQSVHKYENPEIISYEFDILSKKYKEWFDKVLDNK